MEINDNKIYGDSISPDCPRNGGFCHRISKCAYTTSVFVMTARSLHPLTPSGKPYHKAGAYGHWQG